MGLKLIGTLRLIRFNRTIRRLFLVSDIWFRCVRDFETNSPKLFIVLGDILIFCYLIIVISSRTILETRGLMMTGLF